MDEPRHGEDFLFDFYAILGVAGDADQKTIDSAYRKKALEWHTDPHQRLAPEIRTQMEQKMSLFNRAKEILLDPEKRTEYDEQLAGWKGPISTTGTPIIGWDSPRLSSIPLLAGAIEDPDYAKKKREIAAQFSGHDENTFHLLERLYKQSEKPSLELEAAYREALRKRDLYLELESHVAWEMIGYQRRPVEKQMLSNYADEIEVELGEVRQKIVADVEENLALVQRGELKMLGPGGEELTQALLAHPEQAIAHHQEIMGRRFDIGAEKILELARERQILINERLGALEYRYWPEQLEIFSRILIRVEIGENHVWFAFALKQGSSIETDDSVDETTLVDVQDSEDEARKWIGRGYNIILFKGEDNISIHEQLRAVLSTHFERLLQDE